jgi:hypothetical protein
MGVTVSEVVWRPPEVRVTAVGVTAQVPSVEGETAQVRATVPTKELSEVTAMLSAVEVAPAVTVPLVVDGVREKVGPVTTERKTPGAVDVR